MFDRDRSSITFAMAKVKERAAALDIRAARDTIPALARIISEDLALAPRRGRRAIQ